MLFVLALVLALGGVAPEAVRTADSKRPTTATTTMDSPVVNVPAVHAVRSQPTELTSSVTEHRPPVGKLPVGTLLAVIVAATAAVLGRSERLFAATASTLPAAALLGAVSRRGPPLA